MARSTDHSTPSLGLVLVNYGDYAARHLQDFLASLDAQQLCPAPRICVVDNAATPETQALLHRLLPAASIIAEAENTGFAAACNRGIAALREAGCELHLLCNMDLRLHPGAVAALLAALAEDPRAAAAQARLHLHPETELLNSAGNEVHFLGFGFCRGYRSRVAERGTPPRQILFPSGACVLLRDVALCQVGDFDARLWMYCEDQDLGWRLSLAGWRCLYVDDAVAEHLYAFDREQPRYYLLDRNRIICLLKNAHLLTLVLVGPAFVAMECGQVLFAWRRGWLGDKLRVWGYFLSPSHWGPLWRARAEAQGRRRVWERQLVGMIRGRFAYPEIDSLWLRLANLVFGAYWAVARRLVFW